MQISFQCGRNIGIVELLHFEKKQTSKDKHQMKVLIYKGYNERCSFQKNISKNNNSYLFISDQSQELVDVQKTFTNPWKLVSCADRATFLLFSHFCTANKCVDQSQWFTSITSWCNLGWLLVRSSLRNLNCVDTFYVGANLSAPSLLWRKGRQSSRQVKTFCKYSFPCFYRRVKKNWIWMFVDVV